MQLGDIKVQNKLPRPIFGIAPPTDVPIPPGPF